MPKQINVGDAPRPTIKSMELSKYRGVDLTSSPVNVDIRRSPDAPNMMPDADGYPAKRPGWHTVAQFYGPVHGAYALTVGGKTKRLVHAGTALYRLDPAAEEGGMEQNSQLYTGMADDESCAVQLGGKLWILDGHNYLCYDGETVRPVRSMATVPLITIAKAPNGNGATSYKPVNLLTGKRTDSFLGTESDVDYYLSFQNLIDAEVTVETLDQDGVWQTMAPGRYQVDTLLGKVHFSAAPGKSPVEGEDNVHITYEVAGKAEEVERCRMSILYGVNGAMDRVFMTGDPENPNLDRWSEWSDPAYIGDTNYGLLGSDASPIVGYSVLNDCLVAHKQGEEHGRNAFVRRGSLDAEGNAQFLITGVVQGEGALAPRSFASVSSEPLFLTKQGVYALTAADITGEKYAQGRSYYIDSALKRETGLEDACAVAWGRFYVLAVGGRLYLLDTSQKVYESKAPQSAYQLEAYYWTGIDARCLWVQDGALRFGTAEGAVREFWPGGQSKHYSDGDGETAKPVAAWWTTPLMNLSTWANLKTVTGVWVVAQPHTRSGGTIWYATDKEYEKAVREYNVDIFDWNDIDFQRWTFNSLDRPMVVNARKKAKKVKLFQVKVVNDRMHEPFGIFAIHINYRIGSKVKR